MKEYKLLKTEDIPQAEPSFDPNTVKANALNILSFLKNSCVKEGGTYWIFKDSDKNQI